MNNVDDKPSRVGMETLGTLTMAVAGVSIPFIGFYDGFRRKKFRPYERTKEYRRDYKVIVVPTIVWETAEVPLYWLGRGVRESLPSLRKYEI